VPILGSSSKI
jgi:hypothetical protein